MPSSASALEPRSFAVRFSVAQVEGRPVVSDAFLDAQLSWANRIFEGAGVRFERAATEVLPDAHARLETRADRHALGDRLADGVINCFVVASLRDVDDPSRLRMGVHWRPRTHAGKHFVVVAASAGPTVLAHELGHFFGNPRHSSTPGNIMSYERGSVLPFFDPAQTARIRRSARRFVREGELRALPSSQPSAPGG